MLGIGRATGIVVHNLRNGMLFEPYLAVLMPGAGARDLSMHELHVSDG